MRVRPGNGQGILPVSRLQHRVPVVGQNLPHQLADSILVLHQKHGLVPVNLGRSAMGHGLFPIESGKKHLHSGALPWFAGNSDHPAALLYDSVHDGESQTGPATRACEVKNGSNIWDSVSPSIPLPVSLMASTR